MKHKSYSTGMVDPASRLPIDAWFVIGEVRYPCFVVDLTTESARVHCVTTAKPGTRVELHLPDRCRLLAEVIWQSADRMGLELCRGRPLFLR